MSSSFQTTPAKSSRVTKPARRKRDNPLLRRSSSSPFATSPRRKSSSESATKSGAANEDSIYDEPLDDTGVVASLATDLELRDVPQFMQNIQTRMFTPVPERASGMNGQRTAEVLNYRINLPPVVSVAHVHALSRSPTVTEREIAELTRAGVIRKVVVPGRGVGGAAVGEGGVYSFALPNMGPYLRLLTTARAHLLSLLSKTSKYKEAPMTLLKERWDGGIAGDDLATKARKARGDFTGVLPGRTKKWKTFYGLSFEWVLEECAGSGLVELFQTHSVGVGIRAA
ncbi:putative serine-threonine protein kinase 19 protein [Neofusicoccum parvum UCRNP2]|uniref:Putative serine-threonine protein kinase 19 protein n=1 Tax=Botryosphaeria parva (strain UCR-NP2) TaxID=1287680 RepID=R1GYF8_BOTPV|nr:putative serine-threonine protein kinase 19 protein [Neofusicoccum parvum UCRNP2]